MGVNKSRTFTEKTYVYFLFKTAWYVEGGAYRLDISVQGQTT